jgi:phage anti-repressor protein
MEGKNLGHVTVITVDGDRYVTVKSLYGALGKNSKDCKIWFKRQCKKYGLVSGVDYIRISDFLVTVEKAIKIFEQAKKPEVKSADDELDERSLRVKRVREYYLKRERKGKRGRPCNWERDPNRHINPWALSRV